MSLPKAFIIEDDEIISDIFSKAIQEAGYETISLLDGLDALEQLKHHVPDLVVLDLHLPNVAGLFILKTIRGDSRLAKTRVIIVSADAFQSEYLRDEADLVLIKPVGFHQLREMAERLKET